MSSFVEFYTKLGISPVAPQISDINRHFESREHLYSAVGLWPAGLKGKTVIEFGPGGGHNALYTDRLGPSRYLLIEGNPTGQRQIEDFRDSGLLSSRVELLRGMFEEFDSPELFDLVIAEGCIPHQAHPKETVKRLASFVKPGGLFLFTCISAVSYQSEILRRLVPNVMGISHSDVGTVNNTLFEFYDRSLKTLKYATRSTSDWILDNVTQDLEHRSLLDIGSALAALGPRFSLFGCSPSLGLWRHWYKAYAGELSLRQRELDDALRLKTLELFDYRLVNSHLCNQESIELEDLCNENWNLMCDLQKGLVEWPALIENVQRLASLVSCKAPRTSEALTAFAKFAASRDLHVLMNSEAFMSWWGRGQQYVLVRNTQD